MNEADPAQLVPYVTGGAFVLAFIFGAFRVGVLDFAAAAHAGVDDADGSWHAGIVELGK